MDVGLVEVGLEDLSCVAPGGEIGHTVGFVRYLLIVSSWFANICIVTYRIPSFRRNRHLAHSLGGVGKVADVQTSGGIMVVAKLDGGGVEVEIGG